jgi:hypothetical protein
MCSDCGGTILTSPAWQLRAAKREGWQIEYPSWSGSFSADRPPAVHAPRLNVDLTAALSQVETNKDLEDAAFNVTIPPGAERLRSMSCGTAAVGQ